MTELEREIDAVAAETGFSGVVRVDRGGQAELARAYGLAHRGFEIPNTIDTRFATASGTKGLTALAVVSLVEAGSLELADDRAVGARRRSAADRRRRDGRAPAGAPIGHRRLPRRGRRSTSITDYVMPVPVHELATTEEYLAVLGGHPTKFPAGERFSYCNGGYVVLALIAERASGVAVPRARAPARVRAGRHARHRVPALRRAARAAPRSATSTPTAHADERLPPPRARERRRRHLLDRRRLQLASGARSSPAGSCRRSGSPRWCGRAATCPERVAALRPRVLARTPRATRSMLEGYDAGVSFRASTTRSTAITYTVISNSTDGAWPLVRLLLKRLSP